MSISNVVVQIGASAVLQAYPWSSGLPLDSNKVAVVENLLKGRNYGLELVKVVTVGYTVFCSTYYTA
jgi:hypothetical protein